MLDLLFRGATVVDGSGKPPFTADVGVQAGRVVEIGRVTQSARRIEDAHGAWLTPGFVDIHTHYDGQATWDETFCPSIFHGVTTVVMGNCGVGFAPHRHGHEHALIELMEGVEDIPGAALAEGVSFEWQSVPEYMDRLDAMPHSLDYLVQVPHDALRMAVMGERASAHAAATEDDMAAMSQHLSDALRVGAVGFSTGRTDNHRTARGQATPASEADARELTTLASCFAGLEHGVIQVVSDFDVMRTLALPAEQQLARFNAEFDVIESMARAAGRPLSMTWLQRDPGGEQWKAMRKRVEVARSMGLELSLQTASRGIGVIMGLDASFHPFMGRPSYKAVAALPLVERARAMRDPARRQAILGEPNDRVSGDGTPVPPIVDVLLTQIDRISARMFPMAESPNYEPPVTASFYMRSRERGTTALSELYDHLASGDGTQLIYFPIFNYNDANLDVVRDMLSHPHALFGLSDAGAHVGTICDASSTTFMLTHWARDRATNRLPLEQAVRMLTAANAEYLGLNDRGRIAVGQRADLNLIDPARLAVGTPHIVRDLPAGGRRFMQRARGYRGTWVAGQCVQADGTIADARPGRLVRMGRAAMHR